ncbi:hypothetical protein HT136_19210 [Novosphingobium profundi]|nr:hypothetical protein [Novosphingobium profundi]
MRHCLPMVMIIAAAIPASAQARNYDAVAAAPGSHHILLEDERIRVLRVEVAAGATEPVHDHQWPSLMYFEQPQPITYIEYKLIDGIPVETRRVDAPALNIAQAVRVEPEGLHAILNRGTKPFLALRVEFKNDQSLDNR